MRTTIRRFLWRLVPEEPLIRYRQGYTWILSEEMPVSVKYWCFVTIATNTLALGVGSLISRDLVPMKLFLAFTLFAPINMLLTWRYTMRHFNSFRDTPIQFLMPLVTFMSFEWLVIPMLIGASAMLVYLMFER